MNSIYIHIPFCQSRCIYCDFYSTTHAQGMMASYVQALIREMSRRKHYIECSRVNTLYIGGGTPSLLPAELLSAIFEAIHSNFTLTPDAEVTIEANPDDINNDWLKNISQTPINRISRFMYFIREARSEYSSNSPNSLGRAKYTQCNQRAVTQAPVSSIKAR